MIRKWVKIWSFRLVGRPVVESMTRIAGMHAEHMELVVQRQNVILEAHAKLVGYVAGLVRDDAPYSAHGDGAWSEDRLSEMLQEQAMTLAGFDVYVEALKATHEGNA